MNVVKEFDKWQRLNFVSFHFSAESEFFKRISLMKFYRFKDLSEEKIEKKVNLAV